MAITVKLFQIKQDFEISQNVFEININSISYCIAILLEKIIMLIPTPYYFIDFTDNTVVVLLLKKHLAKMHDKDIHHKNIVDNISELAMNQLNNY